jgi:hypothetical protein
VWEPAQMEGASRKKGCPGSAHKADQRGRRCGTGCVRMIRAGQPQDNNERLNRPNVGMAVAAAAVVVAAAAAVVAVPEKQNHVRGYDYGCRTNDFGEAVAGLDACAGDDGIPPEETKSFRRALVGLLGAVVVVVVVAAVGDGAAVDVGATGWH